MDYKPVDIAADDPRLVVKTLAGKEYKFWLCRRGYRIAKHKHGYDIESGAEGEDGLDQMFRVLWIAQLPFSPDVTFDDFETRFLSQDYSDIVAAITEINEKQTVQAKETEEPSKKQTRKG